MNIKEIHMKIIAIGLFPIFVFLAITLPNTTTKALLLGCIMLIVLVVSFIGKSMQKNEATDHDDLLAIPPKKS
jgi:ABC-type transport system involved in cytochrome bd biosynthesis fused ATPase/permease subunit